MKTIPPKAIYTLINLATNLVEFFLGLRIVLKLLGASPSAPFVKWVYETTNPLLGPFVGMFPSSNLQNGLTLEFSSIFALLVYAFIGYLATEAIETLIYFESKRQPKNHRG